MSMKKVFGNKASLLLLSVLVVSLMIVSQIQFVVAQPVDPAFTLDSFYQNWLSGEGFNDLQAKIFLFVIIAILLIVLMTSMGMNAGFSALIGVPVAILFSAYIAPQTLLAIFQTYRPFPLAIATLLPIFALIGLSSLAALKGKRSLIVLQLFAWFTYLIFLVGYVINTWFNPLTVSGSALTNLRISLGVSIIICGLMAFGNGTFMNFAVRRFYGINKAAATTAINQMKTGAKAMRELGKEMEGGK